MAHNGFGLGEVCEALACAVGQIAPNPCYTLFVLIFCAVGKLINLITKI
jgi:hypothetical protein